MAMETSMVERLKYYVLPSLEVPTTIGLYFICDTDADGSPQFHLTTKEEEIYKRQDSAALSLSYHVSAAEAQTSNNPIINKTNYNNTTNPQTIYVRLLNPSTSCQDTSEFELGVHLPPVAVHPSQLVSVTIMVKF